MPSEVREQTPPYRVDQFTFEYEPIRGFPELRWTGKRPFRSTQYFPAQLKESYGDPIKGWMNKIYWGDNLQVMSHLLKDYRGKVRLIYIDPPFDSKADYKKKVELRGEAAAGDHSAFEEKQYTDIWTNDEYLQFMYERLILMRELLADDGSLYVHVDYRKSSYLRLILDELFGAGNIRGEICWKRSPFAGSSKALANRYPTNHDTILFYSKSDSFLFKHHYQPYTEEYLKRFSNPDNDPKGAYRITLLKTYSQERFDEWKAAGKLIPPQSEGAYWSYKQYLSESKGVQPDDVWTDLNLDNPMSNARTGYPTQKPEKLLERIIYCSSNPGDIVFDCFMGSGTTQAVAMKLSRRFIGADINLGAIQTTTKRLISVARELEDMGNDLFSGTAEDDPKVVYTGFEVYNVNNYDLFRNPVEARELLIKALEIQPLPGNSVFDGEKDGWLVKIMPVNRITTIADLGELLGNLDYRIYERRKAEHPATAVERIQLVCMGHDPDLRAQLLSELKKAGYVVEVEIVDILRDREQLQFKRESEARVIIEKGLVVIKEFYPMNLLQKLSLEKNNVKDWRELVDSIMVDFNYDGVVMEPSVQDIPEKGELVSGSYSIPGGAGTIHVKITDLLSESLELTVGQ